MVGLDVLCTLEARKKVISCGYTVLTEQLILFTHGTSCMQLHTRNGVAKRSVLIPVSTLIQESGQRSRRAPAVAYLRIRVAEMEDLARKRRSPPNHCKQRVVAAVTRRQPSGAL